MAGGCEGCTDPQTNFSFKIKRGKSSEGLSTYEQRPEAVEFWSHVPMMKMERVEGSKAAAAALEMSGSTLMRVGGESE